MAGNGTPRAGISAKVGNGTLDGALLAAVTWGLTYFIPAWHSGIPGPVGDALPAIVGLVGYFGGGYLSTHRATVQEVRAAVEEARQVLALEAGPAAPVVTSTHAPATATTSRTTGKA